MGAERREEGWAQLTDEALWLAGAPVAPCPALSVDWAGRAAGRAGGRAGEGDRVAGASGRRTPGCGRRLRSAQVIAPPRPPGPVPSPASPPGAPRAAPRAAPQAAPVGRPAPPPPLSLPSARP